MATIHPDDTNTLHDCRACLGTGIGTAGELPCYACRGKGWLDDRPDLDFDDEGGEHDTTILRS